MNTSSSRRNFLKTALAAVPAALAGGSLARAQAPAAAASQPNGTPLPRRPLGRDGTPVTMISLGGMMNALSPDYLDIAWSMGIRTIDTADCYLGGRSEKIVGQWLAKYPERRKDLFLISKDHPKQGPEQLLEMIDRRLAALGTPYLDTFYIHGIGPKEYGEASLEWPKNEATKKVFEALKSSGKVKKVGFSCHDGRLVEYLNAAAEGGFVDVIMLKYNPFFKKGDPFDLAMDACHKAGIGLVAMKTLRDVKDVPLRLPEFDKLGLTVHQAKLQACWSDSRISAVCNNIDNVDQMLNSTEAARSYKAPLHFAHLELLRNTILAGRRTFCTGCTFCEEFTQRTPLAFHDISRFVTYYEQDGNLEARALYQALPAEARNASAADLAALRDGCHSQTDYPEILRRAELYFA